MKPIHAAIALLTVSAVVSPAMANESARTDRAAEVQALSDSSLFRAEEPGGAVKQPTSEYYQQLTELGLHQSDEGLEVEVLADGSERVNLQGRFMMHSTMLMADGQIQTICTNHPASIHETQAAPKRAEQ